ncbi:CPBP family intramembrane glutamic endopeptidase [Maricaulis sp.]|uniref:CPBP family intramembrane glutamic endopeptidase n=1 Tax=Maricaulis sp. TaxID=1486257 RepID=UPI003A925F53
MRAIGLFLFLAFGISWALAFGAHRAGGFEVMGAMPALALMSAYMVGPSIAALVTALVFDRGRLGEALGFRGFRPGRILVWILAGWLIPLLLVVVAIAVSLLALGEAPADPVAIATAQFEASGQTLPMPVRDLLLIQLAVGLPLAMVFNTVFLTLSEELGWRGWLQPRLAGLGFWPMCLLIGVIWGVWHAPLILMGHNYPGMGWSGVAAMTVFTILLTPYHALARERGGVIAAAAMHGSVNAFAGLSLMLMTAPVWPWNGILGLGGFAVLAAGLLPLWFFRRFRPLAGAR